MFYITIGSSSVVDLSARLNEQVQELQNAFTYSDDSGRMLRFVCYLTGDEQHGFIIRNALINIRVCGALHVQHLLKIHSSH